MTRGDWQRVSRRRPCPVCGRFDWCMYAGPDDAPTAVICPRTPSDQRAGEAGYLHILRTDGPTWPAWRQTLRRAVRMVDNPTGAAPDFAKLAADCCAAVRSDDLQRLAVNLGVTVESLRRLQVGWSRARRGWSFPMSDAGGRILGIRLRLAGGKKLSVKGGREGLFIPSDLHVDGGRLLVCEGPTDTAALLDLGLAAVGRPSCTGGVKLLVELVKQRRPAETIIVADTDAPGQRGAENLAAVLVAYAAAVRVIAPSAGVKDARDWKRRGATAADLAAVIDAAPVRRLTITTRIRKAGHGRRRERTTA